MSYKFNNINLQIFMKKMGMWFDKRNNNFIFIFIVTEIIKRRLPKWHMLERLFRNWNINGGNEYTDDLLRGNWTWESLLKPVNTKARD